MEHYKTYVHNVCISSISSVDITFIFHPCVTLSVSKPDPNASQHRHNAAQFAHYMCIISSDAISVIKYLQCLHKSSAARDVPQTAKLHTNH